MLHPPTLAGVRCLLSAGGRIGREVFPERTGAFCSVQFSRAALPFLSKSTVASYREKKKKKGKPVFSLEIERWWRSFFVSFESQSILALFGFLYILAGVGLHKFLVLHQFCGFDVLAN